MSRNRAATRERRPASKPGSDYAGVWLSKHVADKLYRLKLRPPSVWPVLLAAVFTACRYGGKEAFLSVAGLTQMTGLSERTVKGALAALIAQGLVVRTRRCRHLQINLDIGSEQPEEVRKLAPPKPCPGAARGADKLAPPRDKLTCTSPTSIHSSFKDISKGPFTPQQHQVVIDVLAESSGLFGGDVAQLTIPATDADRLCLPDTATYAEALAMVARTGNRTQARDLVRAVLALRRDPRVQGQELMPVEG